MSNTVNATAAEARLFPKCFVLQTRATIASRSWAPKASRPAQWATIWGWARGNYAANGRPGFLGSRHWRDARAAKDRRLGRIRTLRGIMGCNCAATTQKITDGLSHTVLLGEIRCRTDRIRPARRLGHVGRLPGAAFGASVISSAATTTGRIAWNPMPTTARIASRSRTSLAGVTAANRALAPDPLSHSVCRVPKITAAVGRTGSKPCGPCTPA